MIFYFDMLFLSQKFKFRDNQRHRWIGKLHARQRVLSDFCRGAELVKINWIEKQVAKSSNSDDYATPRKSRRKFVRTNEFFWGKKLREQNSRNLNCRGKNLLGGRWILYQKLRRKYPPQIIVFRWWDIKIYVICLPCPNDKKYCSCFFLTGDVIPLCVRGKKWVNKEWDHEAAEAKLWRGKGDVILLPPAATIDK